jgi:hypothetical protein
MLLLRVIKGILVLLQPTTNVVGDCSGVMTNSEMSFLLTRLWGFWLHEAVVFTKQVGLQHVLEGLVSSEKKQSVIIF